MFTRLFWLADAWHTRELRASNYTNISSVFNLEKRASLFDYISNRWYALCHCGLALFCTVEANVSAAV